MRTSSAEFPGRIRNRLIGMFLLPTILLLALSGWYYFRLARNALEEEMGLRLRSLAGSAVEAISGESVARFVPGDEKGRAYHNSQERLQKLMELGNGERAYVFNSEHRSLLDTKENVAIGTEYYRLDADRWEIEQVIEKQVTMSSTLFTGDDGKLYKAGYAPVVMDGKVKAIVGVDAGVRFFSVLASMRKNMFIFGVIGGLLIVAVSLFVAKGIVRPVGLLVTDAQKIGEGDLEHTIIPTTRDEIGFLANTLNEMRKNIVERDRYLQMLQRGIAHEVRNPLGGMGLFCDILEEELGDDESKVEHVHKIRREVQGLNKVVNDFLDFTREVQIDRRETDIESFISEILMHYAAAADEVNIKIERRIETTRTEVFMDPELIRRALFNLINNAIQAMPLGGLLSIAAEEAEGLLLITVSDTGSGIEQEELESIFTPFFTTKDKGTGLGLPFTKKIAENHGGQIDIHSEIGRGTTVTLILPLDELQA